MTFTVRAMVDGDHYFEPRDFDSEVLAEAFYDSTCSRVQREDPAGVEITVDMSENDTGTVLYSRTFPRS